MSDIEPDEERPDHATFCPDCDTQFLYGEEGFDWETCFECGGNNCYEVPA